MFGEVITLKTKDRSTVLSPMQSRLVFDSRLDGKSERSFK